MPPSSHRRSAFLLLLLMCSGVHIASTVHAHSRFPAPLGLTFGPKGDDAMLLSTTFGLMHTRDGTHWRYLCHGAMDGIDRDSPVAVLTASDEWAVGLIAGVRRTADAGCNFDAGAEALRGVYVSDLQHHAAAIETLFAITAGAERDNGLHVSQDGGASFTARGPSFGDALMRDLRIAPSDPDVIYISTVRPALEAGELPQATVARSEDAGESFEVMPFPLGDEGFELRLLAVDPLRPKRLYAVMRQRDSEPLLRSDDGGAHFEVIFEMPRPLLALALGRDGQDIWVGGTTAGLWHAGDAGGEFEQLSSELQVSCLAHDGNALWACDDSLTSGFQLGRSDDGGAHFTPALHFADVEALTDCAPETPARATCETESRDVLEELQLLREARDGTSMPEAQPADGASKLSGGAGCGIARGPGPDQHGMGAWPLGLGMLWLAWTARRRRRAVHTLVRPTERT